MHSQNQFSATRVNVPSNPVGLDPSVKALLEANRETTVKPFILAALKFSVLPFVEILAAL